MENDRYVSPLSQRYASRQMQEIFSPDRKFRTWRKLWIALAEAEQELGLDISDEQIEELKAHADDINYEDASLQEALSCLSVYYLQYHTIVCCNDFDGTAYLKAIAEEVRTSMEKGGYTFPHLKLLAWSENGEYAKADLIGIARPLEISHTFTTPCISIAVVLNGNAACPAKTLDDIMEKAVETASEAFRLDRMVFKKECFGLGEEE